MAGRIVSRSARPQVGRPPVLPVPVLASRGQRALFALALVTFGLATFYSAIAGLTRVTPVLFKGTNLDIPVIQGAIEQLPAIAAPGESSVVNRRINLVIMGADQRPGYGHEADHTDTLMVATLDPVSKVISVLSFPRDMEIEINLANGYKYKDRINTSFQVGIKNSDGSLAGGAAQVKKDMKANFGLDIDHWVWMDFRGVAKLIDLVGGVTIDIPDDLAVTEPWYYTDDDETDPHYETFPAGENRLNGYRAVAFGRYRQDSDLNRVKRQQVVMQAALQAVFSRGLLGTNPSDLWDTYSAIVKHDIAFIEMGSYIPVLRDGGGSMLTYSLGDPVNGVPTMYDYTDPVTQAALLRWNPDNVRYWIAQTFNRSRYLNSTVEVRNAAGAPATSRTEALASHLQYDRFLPEVLVGPDLTAQPKSSIIVYSASRSPMAEDIAGWMGISTSAITVQTTTVPNPPDIVIVVGQDYAGLATPYARAP